jgi:hypothetical protein
MAQVRVRAPDGSVVGFPEGTSPEEIQRVMQEQFGDAPASAPEGLRTGQPEQAQEPIPFDLGQYGLADDRYANELVEQITQTQDGTEDRDRAVSALTGYLVGRGRVDPETGEARAEGLEGADAAANTANAALRQFSNWSLIPLGDQTAAGVGWVRDRLDGDGDNNRSYRAYLAQEQGRRRGMVAENQAVGTVAGATGLFGGSAVRALGSGAARAAGLAGAREAAEAVGRRAVQAAEGVTRGIRRIPGVGRAAQALDRTAEGRSTIGNIGRSAAQGSLQAGAVTAAQDMSLENVPEAALFGAVVAPGGELLIRGAGRTAQAVGRRFNLENAGYQGLLRRLNTSPQELERRRQQFVRDNRRAPRLAELFDEDEAADVSNLLAPSRKASERARDTAGQAAVERQGNLRRTIQGNRRDFSPSQMTERTGRSFDRAMEGAEEIMVDLDDDLRTLLNDGEVRNLIGGRSNLAARVREATAETGGTNQLSLRDMDTLRQITRDASRGNTPDAQRFAPISQAIRDRASAAVPRYGQAIREGHRRNVTREGYELGRRIRSPGDVDEWNAGVRRADQRSTSAAQPRYQAPEVEGLNVDVARGRAGARIGARQGISRSAQESPIEAARVARSLEADEGLRQRLASVFGVQEAGRLTRVGASEARGARSLRAITPRARNTSSEDAKLVQTVIGAGVAAGGRASGAMIANVGMQLAGYLRGDQTRARQLAAAMFDPAAAPAAIARLKQLGLRNAAISDLYREAARAAGIAVGQGVAENDPADLPPEDLRQ